MAKDEETQSDRPLEIQNTPEMTLAVLRAAWSNGKDSQSNRDPSLDWDALIKLYGGKGNLHTRILFLSNARIPDSKQIIDLATSYLGRPE